VGGGLGIIVIAIIAMLFGVNPSFLFNMLSDGQVMAPGPAPRTGQPLDDNDKIGQFVSAILGETEAAWSDVFAGMGQDYREPTLVMFEGQVQSACGFASAASGPFYCPGDEKVYLDTSFFRDLANRFGAAGDFAPAYVIAHEIGHHVQNQLGIAGKVNAARSRASEAESNQLSVRLELQADCLAGVWANHSDDKLQWLQEGDIEEALAAASAIGDDQLQKQTQGYVVPERFTHGSSEQRVRWFTEGVRSGDIRSCDTFSGAV
jgi:predicted metalloprotease